MSTNPLRNALRTPHTGGGFLCFLSLLLLAACSGDDNRPADPDPQTAESRPETSDTAAHSEPTPALETRTPAQSDAAEPPTSDDPSVLEAVIGNDGRRVSGSYGDLRFAAELTGEGRAQARFEREGAAPLVSNIEGPRRGALDWEDSRIDGIAPPTEAEIEILARVEADYPTTDLALVALDLACQPRAETVDPAIGAALLMPFQMQLYYRMTPPEARASIEDLARRSACQHLRRPMDEIDPDRTPSASVVALTAEQPAPMAYGYFPFEIEGENP